MLSYFSKRGIDCRPFFYPASSMPAYESFVYQNMEEQNPVSYKLSRLGISLPSAANLSEMDVREIEKEDKIFDLGPKTIEYYSKLIAGAGTVFISGPAGFFERENFKYGTTQMLTSVANSMATTIVSGGHLTTALKQQGLANKINHISTAGGALVLYLTGEKLPMMKALEDAAEKYRSK